MHFTQLPENHRHPLAQIGILLKLQSFEKSVPNGSNQLLAVLAALRDHSDTAVVILIFSTHERTNEHSAASAAEERKHPH